MKKRTLLSLLFLLALTVMRAANYKILFLNSPKILINGKPAKVGGVFGKDATITWSDDRQAMKVIEVESKKRYVFAKRSTDRNEMTAMEILTRINHLSTYAPGEEVDPFDKLEMSIASHYDLLDSIEIPTDLKVNDTHYFLGSYKYGDTRIIKRLNHKDGKIIIDKDIFRVDNETLEPRDVLLAIDYVVKSLSNTIFIKNNIELFIIPDILANF